MNRNTDLSDISLNLSSEEKDYLQKINKKSNEVRQGMAIKRDFFNLSIREIFNRWASVHNDIISELSLITFSEKWDISRIDLWWNNIFKLLDELFKAVVKEDRLIYVGITLVLLSMMIYLIKITD